MSATQPKVGGAPGELVRGYAEYEQRLMTILGTLEGSVPGRPRFGARLDRLIDMPAARVPGAATREVRRAVALNEPAITIVGVKAAVSTEVQRVRVRVLVAWRPTKPLDPTRPSELHTTSIDLGAT